MLTKVRKRDGRVVDFDENKIQEAILRAFKQVDGETTPYAQQKAASIAVHIKSQFNDQEIKSIEDVQDQVELGLMSCKRKDVARAYITYRNQRNRERERNLRIFQIVKEKLSASNVQNQNANLDEYSFGGRRGEADSEINKYLALNEYISLRHVENHLNNRIYIHDLDSYVVGMHNCLSIPFDKLLAEGFTTRQTDVRPAGSINTAVQLIAVIFQLQSLQQFGGVSATHLDWTLVPYVRKSFARHYKDGLQFLEGAPEEEVESLEEEPLEDKLDGSIR